MTNRSSRGSRTSRSVGAWRAVGRAYNLCDEVLSGRLARLGLRLSEHELLLVLSAQPGATQQELAARCFVAKSGVSMLLTQMERQGWVVREAHPRDARAKRLCLTEAGQALAEQARQVQAEVAEAMAVGVTAAELDTVADVMSRVCARLEALLSTAQAEAANTAA